MSYQAVRWVLHCSESEGSDRLVALALAEHARADGSRAYPSVPTLANEARVGESTVRAALARLLDAGEITRSDRPHHSGARCYAFPMFATVRGPRVRRRPGQVPPHRRPKPPQDLRSPAGSAVPQDVRSPPQDLAPSTAGSAAEPSYQPPKAVDSPAVVGRASASANGRATTNSLYQSGDIADVVLGVLQRTVDGLAIEEGCKPPSRSAVLAALEEHPVSDSDALEVAQDTRGAVQAQNRAPNIAGLFASKLAQHAATLTNGVAA